MEWMRWDDICRSDEFRGRWVALDECRYDAETGKATEGAVVDVDDDSVRLTRSHASRNRPNATDSLRTTSLR